MGFQQAFGGWVVVDVGYFHKHTDERVRLRRRCSTRRSSSRCRGITRRSTASPAGSISSSTTASAPSRSSAHTNAIFSPPGTGGLLTEEADSDFRIDHDQKFQQTTNLQYTFSQKLGAWAALSWRYDSGLVAGSVPDYATALGLSADQQAAIGLFCGGTVRDAAIAPITACASSDRGATRLNIPADGTEDDLTNPPRIAPRHLFDLGLGIDNLVRTDRAKVKLQFSVVNLTNKDRALQLPVDVQRDALRDAARLPGRSWA